MTEWQILFLGVAKLGLIVGYSCLYAIGGRAWKAIRRFVAPAVLFGGIYGLSFNYTNISLIVVLVVSYWLLAFSLCLGYGGNTSGEKFLRRLKCGLAMTLAGLPLVILTGSWLLLGLQVTVGTLCMLILGIFNPVEAAEEELLIGTVTCIFVPFYV